VLLRYFLSFFITVVVCANVFAQTLSMRKDWYFGRYASVNFNAQNTPSFADNNPYKDYRKVATAYFKNGDFAFLTDGQTIYDQNKTLLNTNGSFVSTFVQVVNHSENDSLFNIISITSIGVCHSIYNAYSNIVVQQPTPFESQSGTNLCMVKHCFADGFWIVVPINGNVWQSYYLSGSSITKGQTSSMPAGETAKLIKIASNFKGDKIAASNYSKDGFAMLYDFDSKCGVLSNGVKLPQNTTQAEWDYPLGIDFSPSNEFLYVCYSGGYSQLVQYKVSDVSKYQVIKSTDNDMNQFDDIAMGPDGRAYLNRHNSGVPSQQIDVITSPNLAGVACGLKENEYTLETLTSGGFYLPPFINCYQKSFCNGVAADYTQGFTGNACLGNALNFEVAYPSGSFDAHQWFVFYNTQKDSSKQKKLDINLSELGSLKVLLVKTFCNLKDSTWYEIEVNSLPTLKALKDTTICNGATIELTAETDAQKILWSTGATTPSVQVDAGSYWIKASNGSCSVADTINISDYPPLSILLGDQYYICERDNELVKLDASKGFVNYLWYPTNDTTQWITVDKRGDYFVLVDDFRGCKGDKGTKIDARCDIVYHVPNAFSPNGDGVNDYFTVVGDGIEKITMQIYNRWGELIFSNNNLEGWDGANAQEGAYVYLIRLEGFSNKKKVFYNLSGNVTLIK